MPKLVILDRDGVINEDSDAYIKSLDEWKPIPGSIEAIARLSRAGLLVTVATNQSGLARGYFDEYTLANIHARLCELVEAEGGRIDGIFFCPHGPDEGCLCRKPGTGLLRRIEEEFGVAVRDAFFVGDSEKDIDAALAMGARPILVMTGKGRGTSAALDVDKRRRVILCDDLAAASQVILNAQSQDAKHDA